jgi:ABC-type transport system involved in cytochrome bd biosynthesis fused ATPase/permease subunit
VETSGSGKGKGKASKKVNHDPSVAKQMNDAQSQIALLKSQLNDAEQHIQSLEWGNNDDHNDEEDVENTNTNVCTSLENCFQPTGGDALLSLRHVNLDIGTSKHGEGSKCELIAVVCAMGSGKSTLLNAILGEVRPIAHTNGIVEVQGNVSYFSHTPFILNDTVQGNILFGTPSSEGGSDRSTSGAEKDGKHKTTISPLDRQRYTKALSVCALSHDLQMFPGGDKCDIGEKGITLSGGQKARISMDRTVYHNADLYLLDDPLATVDAHVGRHLFHKCIQQHIMGYESKSNSNSKTNGDSTNKDANSTTPDKFKPKTVVLVISALQYLSHPRVDRILMLNEGRIQEQGA